MTRWPELRRRRLAEAFASPEPALRASAVAAAARSWDPGTARRLARGLSASGG